MNPVCALLWFRTTPDMAAMHWEARRRQSALERREAHKQQLLQEDRAPAGPHPETEAGPSVNAEEQCPHCKSTLTTTVTGKVPNRYSVSTTA
uniref:Uncharacterized protein n=1 Tax=Knipowitschia caucasica TaxID=637954 RepID=A0AAV2M1A6_KNICA